MWKQLSVIVIASVMTVTVAACGSPGQTGQSEVTPESSAEAEDTGQVSGGWELYENKANTMPDDVQAAFDKAVASFTGSELKPIVYAASQVVAGMNYMILCEATTTAEKPTTSYQMVIVYADVKGNAEITQMKEFDLAAYTQGGSSEISKEKVTGGWEVAEERSSVVIPQDAKDVFDRAMENFSGSEIEPMALLGTQVVAGTNYAFFCFSSLQTDETVRGIQVVTVYADPDNKAEVTNISTVDPADFNP